MIKHKFVSAIPDDSNPSNVQGHNWNEDHNIDDPAALGQLLGIRGISAKAIGAVGDGVTNDTTAIRNAAEEAAELMFSNGPFGSFVYLPRGQYLVDSNLQLPNGVGIRGAGTSATIIKAINGFNDSSLISNQNQDGTQEFAFLESLALDGNRGSAICSVSVLDFGSLFINSYIRDVLIRNGSNVGLHVSAGNGMGPVLIENVWVVNNGGHNVLIEELPGNSNAATGIVCINLTSEHQGSNSSAIYLKGQGSAEQWNFHNIHIEQGTPATGRTGITIDGVASVLMDGVQILADTSTVSEGIKITNAIQNVRLQIRNVFNPNLINPIIRDLKNNLTIPGISVSNYVTPETTIRGGQRFTPASATGSKSIAIQNSSGSDVTWWDDKGQLNGSSFNGAAIDIIGSAANDRPMTLQNNAGTEVFGWYFPAAGGGVLRFRNFTSGVDITQFNTDGSIFNYNPVTFQFSPTFQSKIILQSALTCTTEVFAGPFSSDQTDLNPSNAANGFAFYLTSSVAINVFSMAANISGREFIIYNDNALGGFNITLKTDDSTHGTAAMRFIGRAGADTVLPPKTSARCYYSATKSRIIITSDTL